MDGVGRVAVGQQERRGVVGVAYMGGGGGYCYCWLGGRCHNLKWASQVTQESEFIENNME